MTAARKMASKAPMSELPMEAGFVVDLLMTFDNSPICISAFTFI
jgi:hypothetical protein